MKRSLNVFIAIVLSLAMMTASNTPLSAAANIPEKMRIGLFYEDPKLCSFSAAAEKGLELGYIKENKFNVLYEQMTGDAVSIRKDSFFVKEQNTLKEYAPTANNTVTGETIGPIHIKIGETYTDYNAVQAQIEALKQLEIVAYPAYQNGWEIWTGFYTSQEAAQTDLSNVVQTKLGEGVYSIVQPSTTRLVCLNSSGATILVFDSADSYFQIHPKAENSIYAFSINGKKYRGDIEVRRYTGSDLTIINIVPLEHHIYGVVPSEIGTGVHIEALKAQAVAARTYALKNLGKHAKYGFDLCNKQHCHVYNGLSVETTNTNKAVDQTKGLNLYFNGTLASIFYSATNGGKTEDVRNVWNPELNIPYLKYVEDKYDPAQIWEVVLSAAKIKELTKGSLGDILSVNIAKTAESGRVTELLINGTKDQGRYVRESCRTVLGLKSQLYTLKTDADIYLKAEGISPVKSQLGGKSVLTADGVKTLKAVNNKITVMGADQVKKTVPVTATNYTFTGSGWGHGIGMSQLGAIAAANAGLKYDEILKFYFPGTTIE